ncbi:MAG: hypothetical protein EBU54_17400 [Mycobacteriaceae bacterium]|nr:hypothetical protein [Mycobacteriaceae bacterium]
MSKNLQAILPDAHSLVSHATNMHSLSLPPTPITLGHVSGQYVGAHRDLLIHLQSVPSDEADLLTGLIALWTDPAHAVNLAALKSGDKHLTLENGRLALVNPHFNPTHQPPNSHF